MMHEFEVAGMGIDSDSQAPVLLLREKNGTNAIPIVIGLFEATSIVMALKDENASSPRPMTHDLFCSFIEETGYFIEKILIYNLKNGVYYSNICYKNETDSSKTLLTDARPSDAVALALRFAAPIFVDDKVIVKAKDSFTVQEEDPLEKEEFLDKSDEGKKWADYLKNLNPDDFGKYKI